MRPTRRLGVGLLPIFWAAVVSAQDPVPETSELVISEQVSQASPADPGELFVAANSAYEQGDYETAIRSYRELIARGASGGQIHFNLGNAYLRNGELGRAVAALRRGRRLLPRDEDIRANLAFARDSTRDAIAPPEPSAVMSTLLFWHYSLSPMELAFVTVVVNLVFWGIAIVRIFHHDSEILQWLLILLLVVLLATGGSLVAQKMISRPVAVVVPPEIDAHTAPDSESVIRFRLHAGTEVRVKDEREGWLRIALPDGQQAWIEAVWAEVV